MSLDGKIKSVKNDFLTDLDTFQSQDSDLSNIRQKYLGRNGLVADLFKELGSVPNEDRPKYGQLLNSLKNDIGLKIDSFFSEIEDSNNLDSVDISLPGKSYDIGSIHILEQTLNEIKNTNIEITNRFISVYPSLQKWPCLYHIDNHCPNGKYTRNN